MMYNSPKGLPLALAVAFAFWSGCARPSESSSAMPEAEELCDERLKDEQWAASAVAVICGDNIDGIPVRQVEELIEGRVSGVQVIRRPGGGISLQIRGRGSFSGNMEPLYVLDGVPLQMEPNRGLYWLNPDDILKIEILKDASATAFYGVRGANGVVLITTRRR